MGCKGDWWRAQRAYLVGGRRWARSLQHGQKIETSRVAFQGLGAKVSPVRKYNHFKESCMASSKARRLLLHGSGFRRCFLPQRLFLSTWALLFQSRTPGLFTATVKRSFTKEKFVQESNNINTYMGGSQNYGPFLAPILIRHLIFRGPKRGP